ncbi:MAG: sortase B protein-sorting domain-containing protein [Flavobacteriales bacterium]|nr:sortase B protein-sorting domain-containing protein [Flavobacteriales bacterium]
MRKVLSPKSSDTSRIALFGSLKPPRW